MIRQHDDWDDGPMREKLHNRVLAIFRGNLAVTQDDIDGTLPLRGTEGLDPFFQIVNFHDVIVLSRQGFTDKLSGTCLCFNDQDLRAWHHGSAMKLCIQGISSDKPKISQSPQMNNPLKRGDSPNQGKSL